MTSRGRPSPDRLGGVKAYQVELRLHGKPAGCSELIPLSFARAVRPEFAPGWQQDNTRCDVLRDFAVAAGRVLPKDLVYPPGGQDTPAVGACVNRIATNPADCGPAVDVRVPGDSEADAPTVFGKDPKRWTESEVVSPEGQDAVVAATSKRGSVRLVVAALPERGVDAIEVPSVSAEDVLRAKMVVQAVLGRYFTPHN